MELDINELLNFSPLMKTFTFNAWVVAGFTPITRGSKLDYYINRPQGMKGYIINLTLRGQARAKAGDGSLLCRENDLLLFPPGVPHHYGTGRTQRILGSFMDLLHPPALLDRLAKWDQTTHGIGKTTVNDPEQLQSLRDLFYEVIRHHSASAPLSEALAMNALERLILNCFQQQPISNRHAHDPRINAVCDYLNEHIAQEMKIETLAAMGFPLPSRLAQFVQK
ncbi:Arabinose operon regulatory protein [Klebsiella michiganensis]|nr:Arabinose operon regulatory protein [Klebsiella michiganensis]